MMAKAGEKTYFSAIGEGGQLHSLQKPFSDDGCDQMLVGMGVLFHLLPKPPGKILDLGCGTGWTSLFMARRGYDVTGQDISEEALDMARQFVADQSFAGTLRFVAGDYEGSDADGEYDAAVFYDSLHHAEDEKAAIACAYRALKPGGLLITHEPGEGHATTPASIAAMEKYGVTEKDMPPRHIIQLAHEIGFRRARIYPMPENTLNVMYSTKHLRKLYKKRKTGLFADVVRAFRLARNRGVKSIVYPLDRTGNIVVLVK